jgi:hypothetical protein
MADTPSATRNRSLQPIDAARESHAGASEGVSQVRQICTSWSLEERKMSVMTYRTKNTVKHPVVSGRADRARVTFSTPVIVSPVRKAIARGARLFSHAVEAIAEARMQRAKIEAELYHNRYKHSSKNDDDLPIVR